MRDLIIGGGLLGLFAWSLASARVATLAFLWICFQRPQDFAFGSVSTLPVFQVAFAVTLVSTAARGHLRLRVPVVLGLLLCLAGWMTLSSSFAFSPEHAWALYTAYVPALVLGPLLVCSTLQDEQHLRQAIWVSTGALGLNGMKTGLAGTLSGGIHLSDQISGFVGDNNVFGLVLVMVAAVLMGLRHTLPRRRSVRAAFYTGLTFVVLCVIYTKSRGAQLTLGLVLLTGALLGERPVRHVAALACVVSLIVALVPAEYFDRLNTLSELTADDSAMGRIDNWRLAWDEALAHPWLGVGPNNHIVYNKTAGVDVQVRVAHSVYFQAVGELGFPGLLLFVGAMTAGLVVLVRTWRRGTELIARRREAEWIRPLAFWMICAHVGYLVGAALLNMLYIEYPWYMLCLGSLMLPFASAATGEGSRIGDSRSQERRLPTDRVPDGTVARCAVSARA